MANKFKFDKSLKTYRERLDFVNEHIDIIEGSRYYARIASDYLLMSNDIDNSDGYAYVGNTSNSDRDTLEYKTFKRLKDKWLSSHSMIFTRGTIFSDVPPEIVDEKSMVIGIDKETNAHDNRIFSLFRYENISYDVIKNILNFGCDVNLIDGCDDEFVDVVNYFIDLAYQFTSDDRDREILDLFIQGITIKEVAENIGVSRPAVSKRLKKIINNIVDYLPK